MSDITSIIRRDIEDDVSINSHGVKIEIKSGGLFGRKKLYLSGTVGTETEKEKVSRIAEHHAGNAYEVVDDLSVKATSSNP
jgi:osmotically-inducible protein OsmY